MTNIVMYPAEILRQVAEPVESFGPDLEDLENQLFESCETANGLAVAAPQIGLSLAVFTYQVPRELLQQYGYAYRTLCNPRILASSDDTWTFKEGCLSIPDRFWYITRPAAVTVEYYNLNGTKQWMTDSGLLGRMLQHEIDHLNGRLIVDLLSKHERKQLERELS